MENPQEESDLSGKGPAQDPLVADLASTIFSELRAQGAAWPCAETLAISLAIRLLHRRAASRPERALSPLRNQGLDRRRLTRVVRHIESHLEADLTIARLAKVASLSPFHFARAFKSAVGQAPHRYVVARRIERAKELLKRADRSLLDVAIALNFTTQANFTRAFRRSTGLTPGRYRRDVM
jgi:AraC family transcriptional regulator